ncbi:unnamed protein product, partial [marine sediment metagenome]
MKTKVPFFLFLFILSFSMFLSAKEKIKLSALNSMERIDRAQELFGSCTAEIKAAKNEVESFQIVIAALDENLKIEKAEISD